MPPTLENRKQESCLTGGGKEVPHLSQQQNRGTTKTDEDAGENTLRVN